MVRQCLHVLLLLTMISCNDEDRESVTADDFEAEIIEMNWYSTVKDFYVPEVFDSESQSGHENGRSQRRAFTPLR